MKNKTFFAIFILMFTGGMLIANFLHEDFIRAEKPVKDNHREKFEDDLRESILSFASDSIPADSLYMPDFLK